MLLPGPKARDLLIHISLIDLINFHLCFFFSFFSQTHLSEEAEEEALSPPSFMASSFSPFSSLRFPSSLPNPNSNSNSHPLLPPHTRTLRFTVNSLPDRKLQSSVTPPPPSSEDKSWAVSTGEIFLRLASRLINLRSSNTVVGDFGFDTKKGAYDEEPIGALTEDEVEPVVVWEQRVKDVEAEQERRVITSPGFSFSAAGLLFPYHLGVAKFLIENGYIKETTPLAGSSAGAIVCAVIASGASMEEALEATKILAEDCRSWGTAFRLGAVLRKVLENFLPDDTHIRANGRIRVAVTQLLWRPRGLLVDQFDSKEDLINAVFTSSYIPGYLAPRPATLFRNRLCIDGGLTLFMPPTSAAQTVRVCAFPASRLGLQGIGISPDCNPENRAGPRQLFNWALEPADEEILDHLFELGYVDAAAWALENPLEKILHDDHRSSV